MTTPTNGTPPAPAAPKPGVAPAQPPPATPAAPTEDWKAKYEQKQREDIVNRRAAESKIRTLTAERENERKTFGEKLKDAEAYARLKKTAPVDMGAVAKDLWGDDWYQKLTEYQANGGAPSAASVQHAIEDAERRATERAEAQQREANEKAQAAEQQRAEAQVKHYRNKLLGEAKAALDAKEFPIFARFKSPEALERAVFSLIESHHHVTTERDEGGAVVSPGQVLSFKEAAERLENDMLSIAEAAAEHEKYRPRLAPKLTPAKTPGTVPPVKSSQGQSLPSQSSQGQSQPGRSTLNNDMTGSTPPAPSGFRTEEERKQAALARYAELAKK